LTFEFASRIFNRMVDESHAPESHLDGIFHALADATRRGMLRQLAEGESTVGALAAPHAMSLAAASKHIRVLEHSGLVSRRVDGRTHRVRLETAPLHAGLEWIRHHEQLWHARLDRLAALLDAPDPPPLP